MYVAGLWEREGGWNPEARQILIMFSFELDKIDAYGTIVEWVGGIWEKERRAMVVLRVRKLVRPGLGRSSHEEVG